LQEGNLQRAEGLEAVEVFLNGNLEQAAGKNRTIPHAPDPAVSDPCAKVVLPNIVMMTLLHLC
jgi:hypothetical protein